MGEAVSASNGCIRGHRDRGSGGRAGLVALLLLAAACGADDVGFPIADDSPSAARVVDGVGRGSQGPEVAEVTSYLTRYGYLPNDDLAAQYPRWRPAHAVAPASPDLFDENVETALRRFQQFAGLPATGRADADTRLAMAQPRCGVPDNVLPAVPQSFVPFGPDYVYERWRQNITYRMAVFSADLPSAAQLAATQAAFNSWATHTTLSFSQAASGEDITIGWYGTEHGDGNPFSGELAHAFSGCPRCAGTISGDVHMDEGFNWNNTGNINSPASDVEAVMTHELGHSLGLNHSADTAAVMTPFLSRVIRSLAADDIAGIQSLYGPPQNRGLAYGTMAVSGTTVSGWAYDPDANGAATSVQVHVNGAPAQELVANAHRNDLVDRLNTPDPNHGFSVNLGDLPQGTYTIAAYAVNVGPGPGNALLPGSGVVITVADHLPRGAIEAFDGDAVKGWVVDTEIGAGAVTAELRLGEQTYWTGVADLQRPDLVASGTIPDPAHGFAVPMIGVAPGGVTASVLGTNQDGMVSAVGSLPIVIPDYSATGEVDGITPERTGTGWAYDRNVGPGAVSVQVHVNGTPTATLTADTVRDELVMDGHTPEPAHGFTFGLPSLPDGEHVVEFFAVDPTTSAMTALEGSPLVVRSEGGMTSPVDPPPDEEDAAAGCCSTGDGQGGGVLWGLWVAAMLLRRRPRQTMRLRV